MPIQAISAQCVSSKNNIIYNKYTILGAFLLQIHTMTPTVYLEQTNSPSTLLFNQRQEFWVNLANKMVENGMMQVAMFAGTSKVAVATSPFRQIMYFMEP